MYTIESLLEGLHSFFGFPQLRYPSTSGRRTSSRRYLHASRSTSDILLRRIRLPNIEGPSFHASFPVVLLHHFSQHLKEFTIENKRVHPTVPSIVRHHPLHPLAPTNTQNPRTSPSRQQNMALLEEQLALKTSRLPPVEPCTGSGSC